ncbi:MAG: hypothetical protein B7Y83_18565 [Flavobacteriales bacterium 32-34-25]|nr:MAG: hypothetical protein B7Y83_18565 [Flavobacteriales bacterium 32-34-25]
MRISIKMLNHLKMLKNLIYALLVCLILMIIMYNELTIFIVKYLLVYFFIMYFLPVFIIHINYYIKSSCNSFIINPNRLIYLSNGKEKIIESNQIIKISIFMNGSKDSGFRNFAFESYYFCKLELIDNEEIIITCLHSNQIDKILTDNFQEIEIMKIKTFFPIITSSRKSSLKDKSY